ncbi:phospho-sugar mutase [Lysinibacillus boronitolerans]|uniref:Phosphoglucomutase n=1 Tax=Lysinibacillus boronitolerans JCM 21713 = 10a = NBRC 103108 TaxID=1294264 RepID=A0ABR4Y2G0_9BACI|nr:phospho-sugar mutase [Lysinibacillus boronitolerans]KGR86905.1 phosphoglucomutase [Lysinibacillus boronitolerans JCM 21713 = 10a = NBRC 103108]
MHKELYEEWLHKANCSYQEELNRIINDDQMIKDHFYQYIPFGTGGMRGKLGAGTNRINVHTIRLVAEGLARQIEDQGDYAKKSGVVIAYDTRHFSKEFAYETAGVLATHGIKSYVFRESRPTPELSFAVRYLTAYAGVVITASHNPKEYNGFKVYGQDGAQLTPKFANEIIEHMKRVDDIFTIHSFTKKELLESKFCIEILEDLDNAYNEALKTLVKKTNENADLNIVYTPLHGAGLEPTKRALAEAGFTNVHIVNEQAIQDGNFPTVSYPNPEEALAFEMGITLGKQVGAQLILATDPDADRLGVAISTKDNYQLLTGNQLGALLLNYILTKGRLEGTLPENGVILKTIVTSELGTAIAKSFNVQTINTLTGFKFIAEKIEEFETTGEYSFLFGYEESYGYLAASFVRDKDAVQIALLTAEMASYYQKQNQTLIEVLNHLYKQFGYFGEKLLTFTYDGLDGQLKMKSIMNRLSISPYEEIGNTPVVAMEDYSKGISYLNGTIKPLHLPKADVIKYILQDGSWICVRPSGTEPKCKIYVGVCKNNINEVQSTIDKIIQDVQSIIN